MIATIGNPFNTVNRNIVPSQKITSTVGTRVKEAREEAGISQTGLAKKLGLAQATICGLEKGASKGTQHIAKIALLLNVSALWLETGRGPKHTNSAPSQLSQLSPEEMDLFLMFRSINNTEQSRVMLFVKSIYDSTNKNHVIKTA